MLPMDPFWFFSGQETCPHCNLSLAQLYTHGHGVEEDHERAFQYNMKAAEGAAKDASALAHPRALYNVAVHYFSGKVVSCDLELAAHYFDLAAQEGFVMAQINIGNMYHTGHGVAQDLNKAREYYVMSAHADADAKGLLDSVEAKIAQKESSDDTTMEPPTPSETVRFTCSGIPVFRMTCAHVRASSVRV